MINPHKHTSQEIDNSSFDETLGVSMVEIIGADGVLKNPATEAKQDDMISAINNISGSSYNYIQSDEDATYKYYGYTDGTNWKIKRKTLATGVWEVASGTGDYDTAFADRENKTYDYA